MPKIHVLKDKDGKIVASFERKAGSISLEPDTKHNEGHRIEEIDVAEGYAKNLNTIYKSSGTHSG